MLNAQHFLSTVSWALGVGYFIGSPTAQGHEYGSRSHPPVITTIAEHLLCAKHPSTAGRGQRRRCPFSGRADNPRTETDHSKTASAVRAPQAVEVSRGSG